MAMRELVTGGTACAEPGSSSSSNPLGALANTLYWFFVSKVYRYPSMCTTQDSGCQLEVVEGQISNSQITVLYGEKRSGMTPDSKGAFDSELPEFRISYLHQNIAVDYFLKYPGPVRDLLWTFRCFAYQLPKFVSNVMVPLQVPLLMDRDAMELSKAEMDNVSLCIFLWKERLPEIPTSTLNTSGNNIYSGSGEPLSALPGAELEHPLQHQNSGFVNGFNAANDNRISGVWDGIQNPQVPHFHPQGHPQLQLELNEYYKRVEFGRGNLWESFKD